MMLEALAVLGFPCGPEYGGCYLGCGDCQRHPIGLDSSFISMTAGCTILAGGSGGTPGTYARGIVDATGTGL